MVEIEERKYISPASLYHVWEVGKTYEIFDNNGWRVCTFYGVGDSVLQLAKLAADAMERKNHK